MIVYPICTLAIEDDDDREFMTALYKTYYKLMYSQIYKITKDTWLADDILQTTLLRLIDKLEVIRHMERNNLVNYIIVATRNTAINAVTRKPLDFSFDELIDTPQQDDPLSIDLEKLERQANLNLLHQVWPKLDDRHKFLLEGKYILQLSVEEMAEELDIKPASVRMALTRAKRAAKEWMLQEMDA